MSIPEGLGAQLLESNCGLLTSGGLMGKTNTSQNMPFDSATPFPLPKHMVSQSCCFLQVALVLKLNVGQRSVDCALKPKNANHPPTVPYFFKNSNNCRVCNCVLVGVANVLLLGLCE